MGDLKNWRKIKQNIRGIVGVNLTNKEMDHMYEVFMDSRAYSYKAVNKYNIPYAMIRYQEAISIYRTFLFDSPMSEIVKDRINCNSKYFEIPDKEIVKKGSGFYNIGIYFTKYQRKEHKQYIHMVIYEADGYGKEGRNSILEESIEMKSWIYE